MSNAVDLGFLERAAKIAESGALAVEPNPQVGAVIVRDGEVVGEGAHTRYGGAHAEVLALLAAGERARGATCYVTLEPCSTQGKTPPCTEAISRAGIARVVFGVADPNPLHHGRARAFLATAGIQVEGPIAPHLAPGLLRRFQRFLGSDRPYVIAKWAMTLDGKIATRTRASQWLTGDAARASVHELRGHVDAIAVGSGTVRADRPRLTARPTGPRTPQRVVFDRHLEVPLDWPALSDGGPGVILLGGRASDPSKGRRLRDLGVEVLLVDGADRASHARAGLQELRTRGIARLLVEGGAGLLGALFEARCVDQVCAFVAPIVLGGEAAPSPVAGQGAASLRDGIRITAASWSKLGDDYRLEGFVAE